MAQFIRPVSDVALPGVFDPAFAADYWSTPAWDKIDESVPSDGDFTSFTHVNPATGPSFGVYHFMGMSDAVAPATTDITFRVRISVTRGSNEGQSLQCYLGSGPVASLNDMAGAGWTVGVDFPADGAFHTITSTTTFFGTPDWSDLYGYLQYSWGGPSGGTIDTVRVSWFEVEVSDPAANWWRLDLPTFVAYLSQLLQPVDYILPYDIFSGGVFYPAGTSFPWTGTVAPTDKGWWMANADAFAGAPYVINFDSRPEAPRGFAELSAFATGSTKWCGGFPGPCAGFKNHLVYAVGGYTVGTDSPTLRIYDGLFDRPIATIPNTSANAVPKAVTSLLTAAGQVFVATFDSGTSSADWVGRVFALDIESGQMTPMGNPLPTGHLPYALCWHAGRLWCGTHRQSSAASGKVFYLRPGIDSDWTADYDLSTSSVANCSSLCSFQGKLYVGTTAAAGTFAKVLVRDTAGAYTTSLTLSGGAATANNGVPALAEFANKLYATYYNGDAPIIASIRKYDGSSWDVAYTGSGSTLVPYVGLPTDLTNLLAIGGAVGVAAVLLKTNDGTTWTDQTVFLSQSSPSSAGLPAFGVVVH